jgi:hypothetical protein
MLTVGVIVELELTSMRVAIAGEKVSFLRNQHQGTVKVSNV